MVVIDCSKMSMKNGSKDITTLQKELNKLGYYKRTFDTVYGYYTKQGVKQFQKKYGLSQDGVFGPKTCKKLNEVAEEKNTTKTTTSTTATVSTKSIFDCPKISLKRSTTYSSDVKTLQSYLSQLKYYTRQVDGVFGEYTEKAVKQFQKDYKLKEDGWFAQLTCNKLTQVVASKNLTTTSSSSSSATKTSTTYTPEYAKQTSATLTLLPEVVVLPVSELDEATNTKTVTGGSISTDTNFDCSKISLRRNSDSTEEVRKLQTLLASRGYYTRQIDGDFGKYTENAVKKLQSAQGNDPDGWFGPKTCAKLQGTSATSNTATGTADKKAKKHTITDIKVTPQITDDMDGLSHDITLQTPYSEDKFGYMRKLQKTIFEYKKDTDVIIHHEGYINEIKLSQEDGAFMIELQIVGYTAFLDMTVEFEKTAKRSVLIQDLAALCGLKAVVDTTGLTDDEYTIKVQKATTTGTGNGATGLTQLNGDDCTGHYQTNSLSAWSNDIDKCGGNTKIGNSSANYATETAGMSGKEAILSIWNRFQYGKPGNSSVYRDNEVCPRKLWNKTGTVYGNCADISRLVKCVGEVHGLKVGIKHAPDHYYNLIEWEGKVHTFDCCYKSKRGWYAGEKNNTLCFFNGPWSNG